MKQYCKQGIFLFDIFVWLNNKTSFEVWYNKHLKDASAPLV